MVHICARRRERAYNGDVDRQLRIGAAVVTLGATALVDAFFAAATAAEGDLRGSRFPILTRDLVGGRVGATRVAALHRELGELRIVLGSNEGGRDFRPVVGAIERACQMAVETGEGIALV